MSTLIGAVPARMPMEGEDWTNFLWSADERLWAQRLLPVSSAMLEALEVTMLSARTHVVNFRQICCWHLVEWRWSILGSWRPNSSNSYKTAFSDFPTRGFSPFLAALKGRRSIHKVEWVLQSRGHSLAGKAWREWGSFLVRHYVRLVALSHLDVIPVDHALSSWSGVPVSSFFQINHKSRYMAVQNPSPFSLINSFFFLRKLPFHSFG